MSHLRRNGISTKLFRIPRDLLLALLNTTAILVIAASVLALIAITRINNFARNIVATTTEAAVSKIGLPSKNVLENLRNVRQDVRTLGDNLRQIKEGEIPFLQSEIAKLKDTLNAVNMSVNRLTDMKTMMTDAAIEQANNPQQSWGFEGEPPEAVIKDVGTRDGTL